jgi:methylglyoxal synthase
VQTAYEFIGLSEEGNRQIASMTHDDYKKKMIRWQNWINEHLEGLRSKRM